jgi:hypothetical protein
MVRTEEAEVAKLQYSAVRTVEQPQECSPDAERSRGHGSVWERRRAEQGRRRVPVHHHAEDRRQMGRTVPQMTSMACATAPQALFHC